MDLSRDAQLRIEQDLKTVRRGYTCNVQRLNGGSAHLKQHACHEDLGHVGSLLVEHSLVGETPQRAGASDVRPSYDQITTALQSGVVSLIDHHFDRVLLMIAGELELLPILAGDFNACLGNVGRLLASNYDGMIEESDFTLRTDFNSKPPERGTALRGYRNCSKLNTAIVKFFEARLLVPSLAVREPCLQPLRSASYATTG